MLPTTRIGRFWKGGRMKGGRWRFSEEDDDTWDETAGTEATMTGTRGWGFFCCTRQAASNLNTLVGRHETYVREYDCGMMDWSFRRCICATGRSGENPRGGVQRVQKPRTASTSSRMAFVRGLATAMTSLGCCRLGAAVLLT